MCGSTCFGRLHACHQELTTALQPLVLPLELGGSSVVGCDLAGCDNRLDHNQQHCYHQAPTVKPEAANAGISS